jgi:hypothetical protein
MMMSLQRKIGDRSSLGAFIVDRQVIDGEALIDESNHSNRVIGIDYNLKSSDNKWDGKYYYHQSSQAVGKNGSSAQAEITYIDKYWEIIEDLTSVDEHFRADLGYVPRVDILKWGNGISRFTYPENSQFNSHKWRFLTVGYFKPTEDYEKTDHLVQLGWLGTWKDQSNLDIRVNNNYVKLIRDFDPTRSGALPLNAGDEFHYNQLYAKYTTSTADRLTYNVATTIGEFFNGDIQAVSGEVAYRIQPWGQLSFRADYNQIDLPEPYGRADIWLAQAKAEIAFNRALFWNTLIQYSSQGKALGINSRVQWRFAPLSDLYFVYNDSYYTDNYEPRFRSFNIKVNYWFDI